MNRDVRQTVRREHSWLRLLVASIDGATRLRDRVASSGSEGPGHNRSMDRARKALANVDMTGLGLEIGPSYNPIVPKSSGVAIRTMDHTTAQGLRTKYAAIGLDQAALDRIDDVDYVWSGKSLRESIPTGEEFTYVVAAHVVEHSVDLIGFLNQCGEILAPGGVVSLIVPDQRFCFDHYRPLTSAGQAVEAHLFPRTTHGPASFIDTHLYTARRHGTDTWDLGLTDGIALAPCPWPAVAETVGRVLESGEYIDIHRWVFTPASFELLLFDLRQLGYLDLVVDDIAAPGGFEFYATLRLPKSDDPKSGTGDVSDDYRWHMLQRIDAELRIGSLLDTPGKPPSLFRRVRRKIGRAVRRP